jgi:hypothetical protein
MDRQKTEPVQKLTRAEYLKGWRAERKSKGLCFRCDDPVTTIGTVHCEKCSTRSKPYEAALRAQRKQDGLCALGCGQVAAEGKVRCDDCTKSHSDYQKNEYRKLKHEIVIAYGEECICCGERIEMLLTLDHKLNDGSLARQKSNYNALTHYREVLAAGCPDTYQLLCWNCNYGKFRNGGVCPHQTLTT